MLLFEFLTNLILSVRGTNRLPCIALLAISSLAEASSWTFPVVDNAGLPPAFVQGQSRRADGSTLTFFVAQSKDGGRRPLLVYIEGSGAQSHFVRVGDKIGYTTFGGLAGNVDGDYHVAATEKRGVSFGDQGQRGTAGGASAEYNRHATLADRVADTLLLLDTLLAETLVDPNCVLLIGHSEGADVAAAVSARDPRVTHVAFLSGGGATQFFDLLILERRELESRGSKAEDIERAIDTLVDQYRKILESPDSQTEFFAGHAFRRWSSFATVPAVENLVQSKAMLFLGHGSADSAVPIESFDLLVVELLRHRRKDVTVRRYPGTDHSFIPVGAEPSIDPFMRVVDEILQWANPN